jgi:hypothetical protein
MTKTLMKYELLRASDDAAQLNADHLQLKLFLHVETPFIMGMSDRDAIH